MLCSDHCRDNIATTIGMDFSMPYLSQASSEAMMTINQDVIGNFHGQICLQNFFLT